MFVFPELYNGYLDMPKKYNYKPIRVWTHERPFILISDYKNAKVTVY